MRKSTAAQGKALTMEQVAAIVDKATVSAPTASFIVDCFVEEREQLWALASVLMVTLGRDCNEGKDPPDDAPLMAWRIAQVLHHSLESNQLERLSRDLLAREAYGPRAS